jgi:RNA polymerase sigma-70 factor (ECF subfamily)
METDAVGADSNEPVPGAVKCEKDTIEALYDEYGRRLFHYLLVLLGSTWAAEDALQELFLNLVRSENSLRDVKNMTGYLFASAKHISWRMLKRRKEEQVEERHDAGVILVAPDEKSKPDAEQLSKAIAALPAEQREALVLKVYEDMTFEEIAAVAGTSPNTAASRYRYAIEKLKASIFPT